MVNAEDLLIFKMREKKAAGTETEANKTKELVEEAASKLLQAAPPPNPELETRQLGEEVGIYVHTKKAERQPSNVIVVTGRELIDAKGKYCEWHPWRPAYAVCDYCHRAFCYEDTIEFGKGYYCLEDIDKVSEAYTEKLYSKYNSISFISAGMFMFLFVIFTYFASGQLLYVLDYSMQVGIISFLWNMNYSYGSALMGFVLATLGLVGAVLIFIQSRRGFLIGLIVGLGGTAFFTYQFLNSGTVYFAVMSAMAFAALAILAYSKFSYVAPEPTLYGVGGPMSAVSRSVPAQNF